MRPAIIDDMPILLNLVEKLYKSSPYKNYYGFSSDTVKTILMKHIEYKTIFTDGEHCIVSFEIAPMLGNINVLCAYEIFLFTDDGFGHRLMKGIKIAKEVFKQRDVKTMILGRLKKESHDKTGNIYKKMGFDDVETFSIGRL